MPFLDWEDHEDCVQDMISEGYTEEEAEKICGSLEAESKLEEGDPEGLLKEIMQNANHVITDLGLDLVSAVKTPAQPSDWIMLKSEDPEHDWNSQTPIVFNEEIAKQVAEEGDEERRIAFAPALVPNQTDKQGDVVPSATIYDSAHRFMKKARGDEIDTEHNLIDEKGNIVESWTLKKEQTFELPNGETKTYPPVTWMLGIEFDQETWKRIKDGELQGLSIMGKSEKVAVNKQTKKELVENCPHCGGVIEEKDVEEDKSGEKVQNDGKPLSKEQDSQHDKMSDEDITELKETLGTLKEQVSNIESRLEEKEQKEKLESKDGVKELLSEKFDEEKAEAIIDTLTEDQEKETEPESETEGKEEDEDEEDEDEEKEGEEEKDEEPKDPAEKGYSGQGVQQEKKSLENQTEKALATRIGDVEDAVRKKYEGDN